MRKPLWTHEVASKVLRPCQNGAQKTTPVVQMDKPICTTASSRAFLIGDEKCGLEAFCLFCAVFVGWGVLCVPWILAETVRTNEPTAFAAAVERLKEIIVHFDEVVPGVFRGGLIPEEATPLLKDLGIKTVINFDNNEDRAKKEEEYLKLFGIYTARIPWSGWDHPRDEDIEKFLALMKTSELRPVMVHCKRGSERTGVAMATWRVSELGWRAEQAYEEMKRYDFRRFTRGHLKKYLYRFAKDRGDEGAELTNLFERIKINTFYLFYQLRKLNPFLNR